MLQRAHSTFEVKSVDDDLRIIAGIASTPALDRQGDVMSSAGAKFTLPMPLLWQHRHDQPIGEVIAAEVKPSGIHITARIAKGVLPRIDEAWSLIKSGLVRGLSIGWLPLQAKFIDGEFHVSEWEWLELSAVTVPANAGATITAIKSIDAHDLAASGTGHRAIVHTPAGVSASPRARGRPMAKTITEQISAYEARRQANAARMSEIMQKAADEGVTLDESQQDEYDGLSAEVKSVDAHLVRLRDLEKANVAAAVEVTAQTPAAAAAVRDPHHIPVVRVKRNTEPGIEFAQAMLCKLASFLSQGSHSPVDIARSRYPDNDRIQTYLKATVPAGTTTDAAWAGPLVDPTNLANEFIEFLRPQTILGKFGMNGIPSLRRVPFNVRVVGQTTGGNAWWVGQGAPKPLTSFAFEATTLTWAKIAAIAVVTRELARFSSPSAEMLVRDQLAAALRDQLDRDFVDPATAAVANVSPASITNGLTALSSAGTSADNIRTDIQNLLEQFILQNINPAQAVLIMPNTLALAASLLRNSLGQKEFPDLNMNGGFLEGLPVITSQHAANLSGAGNMVIAVNADEVFLSDDGQVTVEASTEASLQMLDNPTNNAASGTATTMVSMFQTNSIALLAERFINWQRRRTGSVAYMDDVNWGSIGSPS